MRRLLQVSAITSLLVVMASGAYAATTVRSGKSNSSDRVAVYDTMTPTEVTAFLAEWDKIPLGSTTEAAVRRILQKVLGTKAGSIKKIIIQSDKKPARVILLGDPNNAQEALAVRDPAGMPAGKAAQ
jgi:predicted metal-dependent phosphotriesterase family hydrolase